MTLVEIGWNKTVNAGPLHGEQHSLPDGLCQWRICPAFPSDSKIEKVKSCRRMSKLARTEG